MKIETAFTPGDKAFIVCGEWGSQIAEYTVGQVRVEVTESLGAPEDAEIDGMPAREFSNYAPQRAFKEEIMCVESGIGSGSIWTYGKHAFTSMEAAKRGQERIQADHADAIAKRKQYEEKRRQEDIEYHRRRLESLVSGAKEDPVF